MLILHKGHTDTIQAYSVTVMTHVKALQAGHSSQGTSEPITPASETGSTDDGLLGFSTNRHNPVMVYNDLRIRNTTVHDYNKNRSQPVTIQCPITWVGALVDRRRQTNRALIKFKFKFIYFPSLKIYIVYMYNIGFYRIFTI